MTMLMTMNNFEYMDKASIDTDLNCEYCNNPLIDPVSTPCKHTFCRACIENKIKKTGGTCAKPKCKNKSIALEDLIPVTERIVLNMLDRLLVKCTLCGAPNIPRGTFEKHATKLCPKAVVYCSAIDLKCPWTGSSSQLKQHIILCPYEQIRPILSEILQENYQLKEQIQHVSEQCVKNHSGYIKELQETNQCLSINVVQLKDDLSYEKIQLKNLKNEVQKLKELILQGKNQIDQLQIETQHEKEEIIRIDQRCHRQENEINQLNDQFNKHEEIYNYENSQLKMSISKCQSHATVDLSKQQLLDRDMETIVKQALIEKQCTRLDLGYNCLTSIGISILADGLKHNTTLEELDFHNNRLSDLGVYRLTEVLSTNTSILKALGLGSNGITDKGAEHLAEMLKTNRSITWLALAGNQIGDYGVQLLANTLAHQNTSLHVLSLHVNKSISDNSIDSIIYMLENNQSLRKLWIQDCNLTEQGKLKLREAAKMKQGFSLYTS